MDDYERFEVKVVKVFSFWQLLQVRLGKKDRVLFMFEKKKEKVVTV